MERMIDRLQGLADAGDVLVRDVTLPLAQGMHAFAQGAYSEAVRYLAPLFTEPRLDQLARIGGSHAQREVFEDTMLEASLRAEQFDQAEAMLRARLRRRDSARDLFWLARTQMRRGQPEAAQTSLHKVSQQWQDADPGSPERTALTPLAAQAH